MTGLCSRVLARLCKMSMEAADGLRRSLDFVQPKLALAQGGVTAKSKES
jgi:hypothetical protein